MIIKKQRRSMRLRKRKASGRACRAMEERVLREMAEFGRKSEWPLYYFFNNFSTHLPGGFFRRIEGQLDHGKYYARNRGKRRRLAVVEFHRDIDRAIKELGMDPVKIGRLNRFRDPRKLHDYILPLYVRLREKGYKHYPALTA